MTRMPPALFAAMIFLAVLLMGPMGCAASVSAPASAEARGGLEGRNRFWAFDAADPLTRSMTRGLTLEVRRGLFGAVRVEALHSTTERASINIRRGGPDAAWRALPDGARERAVYSIDAEDPIGQALSRALCPGSEGAWLVTGRVVQGRPLAIQAVGRWSDGGYRHCATLRYTYRGEWARLPEQGVFIDAHP